MCKKNKAFRFLDFRSYTFDAFQVYLDPPVPPKNVFWHLYFFWGYLHVFAGSRYLEYVYIYIIYIIFIFIFIFYCIINNIYIYICICFSYFLKHVFPKNRMMGSSPIDTPWTWMWDFTKLFLAHAGDISTQKLRKKTELTQFCQNV